uniref:Terminase small subunit n=1 Tax=Pseudomonas phage Pavpe01 TaxID=3138545 RepID=A0AAU6VZR6_9VIRU
MDDTKSKAAYAAFLLKERDPFKAACMLCPDDTGRALWHATNWPNDPEVLAEMERLRNSPDKLGQIASKFELARFYWDLAQDSKLDAKDRIAAAEKYGAVAGIYDPRQTNTTNVNIENAPRVMVVKDHGTDEEWEKKAAAQQSALTGGKYVANTRH